MPTSPARPPGRLVPARVRPDRNPAAVYLAGLAPGSRPAQRAALGTIARDLSGGTCTLETLPWHRLRFQHTAAARTMLAERYKPATVNRALAALRGALKAAWRLGLMS